MWTSTLEISVKRVVPTRVLGLFWRGAYFSSLAPLQVKNLPRQPLVSENGNRVRVHNRLAGICGSDLHLVFVDGDLRIAPAALPSHGLSYPGHEVVGEVIEIGEQVQNLRVGDRVVLQSGPNCLSAGVQPPCGACATGNYNLCQNGNLPGPGQIGGGWSEEMLVHEQQLFRIPPEMEDEQAVLLEPTAVAVHAVLRRLPRAGEKVLIVGAGTIGLLTLQVIRALAPQAEVSVMARHDFQCEQAMHMGAAHIFQGQNSYEKVEKATGGKLYRGMLGNKMLLGGYDVIFDTVGTRQTIHDCLRWTRARGTVVLVGVSPHQVKLDLSPIWYQEVNLIGSTAHGIEIWPVGTDQQRSTFSIASDLITNGLLHLEKFITHRFALSNFREALQYAADKKNSQAIKVIFDAALLPASSVPSAQPAARTRRPGLGTGDLQAKPARDSASLPLTPAGQNAPSTGPSHFTMLQSEDFTADFDNTQFVNLKMRRPPTPLQFPRTTEDIPTAPRPIVPSGATNSASQALQQAEEIESRPEPRNEA
jgi:2-desacetyl-2-hydroxyethyl bacteriochlorophyllide A dehydrogenase